MMERTLRYLVLVSLVVCMLAVAPVIADPATTPLDLTAPAFITSSDAEAEGACTPAFNVSAAGISSHVKVAQAVNLVNAVSAFDQILEWDDTHALGEIWIVNKHITLKPLVYVDTAGNIVAFFPKGVLTSSLISWNGVTLSSPTIADFTTNLAIWEMCNKTGISYAAIKPGIKYYHFGYPDADKILIFVNGCPVAASETAHIFVPAAFTQYEASGSLVSGGGWTTSLYVDSKSFMTTTNVNIFNYGSSLQKGQPHTITLYSPSNYYEGAVGTTIVYSEG